MNFCLNINNPDISKLISLIGYNTLSQIIEYNGIEILDIIKEKLFIDLKDELKKSYEYQLNNKKFNDSIDNMNEISFWRMFTPSFYNWFGDWMIQYKLQNGLQLSEKEQDVLATKYEGSYDRLKADVSKVVTDNGLPKLVYHGSNYDFTDFDTKYWGFAHFGTFDAAYDRLIRFKYGIEEDGYIINGTIKSYFLNIKKEKEIEDIGDKWEKISIADDEGLIYINKSEDKGSISYAISNPNQTKSAILPSENMGTLLIENLVEELKVTPTQAKQLIPTKFLNPTNSKIMYFQRLNGGTYGFVTPDGKVFIDKSTQSLNTPFHEFYHIYDKIILSNYDFDSRAKSIIDRANQLAVEGGYLNRVKQLNAYKDDDEEQQLAEARAMLIGDASSSKINEAEHGFLMKLKALLKDLVDYILDIIGTKSFKNYTPEQILNMTMEEFTNVMTHDMLYDKSFGKHLTPEQRQNIQELKDLEPAYAQASDEEVQEFIESIYPESQIKDIVWHGTNTQLDLNTKPKQRNFEFTKGFHFDYIYKKAYMWGKNVIPAIVDVRNPYEIKRTDDIEYARDRYMKSDYLSALAINDYDPNTDESTMYKDGIIKKHDTETGGEYLNVASKKQITILNSPETIQKFQEFLDRKKYNGIHITLGRSAQRSFGKVQNIIISYNGKEITSQDNVPGLGEMNVVINNNEVYVGNIRLPLEYQGKGLAKHIYQAVADKLQLPVVNSKERGQEQSESGGYVWKNRTVFLPNSKKNKTNFQDLTPIKPGVEELFESNPELANAVYEALGIYQPTITSEDKIIFGHPTIGKTFLKEKGITNFISFDDDFAEEINNFVNTHKGNLDKYQYKQSKPKEYIDFSLSLYDKAKAKAKKEGKVLFTSSNIIFENRIDDFDKVINLEREEFFKRIGERKTTYDIIAWKDQIDNLISKVNSDKVINTRLYLSDLLKNATIKPTDKIIWGHPAIGKSYAAKKVKMIDFDSYKLGINRKYNLYIAPGLSDTELRTDDKTREARENWRYESEENQALWNQFIRDVWQQAKKDAKEQGAILFASDLLVLREFSSEVDKVLTMPDELFFERSKQRNNFIDGSLGTKVWKNNLNKAVNNFKEKFGENKVINTEKYLSDLFITPQQKQQALQLYSSYLDTIFPDSKVKDIVYRGLSNKSDNSIKEDSYWTQYITLAYDYIDRQQSSWENGLLNKYDNPEDIPIEEWNSFEGVLQQAIVNIKKPFMDKEGLFSLNKKEGYDASIGNVKDVLGEEPQILIYKPEQVHILGSEQDIDGFKKFVEKETSNIQFQQSNQLIPTQQSETYDYVFQKLFDNFKPYVSELITDRDRANEILELYNKTVKQSISYKELNDFYNSFIDDLKQYEDIILNQIDNMFDIPNEEELYNEMLDKYKNKFLYFGIPEILSTILMKHNKLTSIKVDIPYFIEHVLLNKNHNINLDTIYNLVELLHKPIAVFKNIPYANRYKIITDKIININSKPKVLCIVLNTEFENKEEIYPGIVTAYFMDYELNTLIYHNALISADKEKLIKLVDTINNNQDEITVTTELRDIDMVLDNEIRQTAPKSTVSISNIIGKIIDYKVINYKQENIQFQDLSEYNNENEQKEFTKEPYFNNNTENFDTNSAVENQVIEFSNNESSYTWNINTNPDNIIKRLQLKYPDLDFVIIKEQQDNNELLKAKVKPNKLKRFNLNNPIIESLDLDIFTIDDELKNKRNNIELFFNGDVGIVMNNTIYFIYRDLFSTSPLKVILNEELKDFTVMSVDQVNQKITSDNVVYMTKDEYDNIKKELYKTSRKIQDLMQQQALSKIELLKKIKDTTPYRYYELLSDQLINNLPLLKNKKIRLSSISNISYYNPKTDKVYYNLDYINNAMVLLHELMHNFKNKGSIRKLSENDEQFFNKLKTLYEKALGYSVNTNAELFTGYEQKMGIDGNVYYGLTNLNEFLAESMVNPEFQEYLASIKTESNNSILSEIYQALVSLIKHLLNTDITNESNLLKDTIDTIVDFMENHNIYENMGEDLQWDKWKIQMITIDPNMTFEVWQGLTNKEKIKIINCI